MEGLPAALVILDMAGTTVRDDGEVAAAFTTALAEHGVTATEAELGAVRGSSKRSAMRGLVGGGPDGERRAESAYASFRGQLVRHYESGGAAPVAGAEQCFKALRAGGARIALNTGFDRDIAALVLRALGWDRGIVDATVCGDDVPEGRPAPYLIFRAMEYTGTTSVHQVANVGDTALDLMAGHNAGVHWNIGVLSGAHDARRLGQAPHTHLLGSIAELPAFLASG